MDARWDGSSLCGSCCVITADKSRLHARRITDQALSLPAGPGAAWPGRDLADEGALCETECLGYVQGFGGATTADSTATPRSGVALRSLSLPVLSIWPYRLFGCFRSAVQRPGAPSGPLFFCVGCVY